MASLFKKMNKASEFSDVITDDGVFMLHYGVTILILITFAFVVSCNTNNESVSCFKQDDIPSKFLDAFCRMRSHFNAFEKPAPIHENSEKEQTTIFQDSDDVLFFRLITGSIMFLAPKFFWKFDESGRLEALLSVLNNNRNKRADNLKNLADVILVDATKNKSYFINYLLAAILNAVNATASLILLEIYHGKPFTGTAVDVIELADRDWSLCWKIHCDNSKVTLQKFTKSVIYRHTLLGDVEQRDAIAMLPTNIIYEKIYIFLWYWFFTLCILSYSWIVYRLLQALFPILQAKVLKLKCMDINIIDLLLVVKKLKTGNWFLIHLLSKNVDSQTFSDLMLILANKIRSEIVEVGENL
ncbi:Innexin inx2 like protein [Argiope bruennichi]|uniref:Innexin n=1 Tax=Argiope bruennichi TaxID=94029 RepID=A0A8T0EXQ4_ARGBR|nr:Innexin inx2 like protein [Argiope bruennichi]